MVKRSNTSRFAHYQKFSGVNCVAVRLLCQSLIITARVCLQSPLQFPTLLMTAHQLCCYSDTAFTVCPFLENQI